MRSLLQVPRVFGGIEMPRDPQDVDRSTTEDTARMQAIWTGIILAVSVLVASFVYFNNRQTDMASSPSPGMSRSQSR
jgi:hypothetical protein